MTTPEHHESLLGALDRAGCRLVTVVGTAKNAGKTTALMALVEQAVTAGRSVGLLSFGRDGEAVDALTRNPKPRIIVPPGGYFATVPALAGIGGDIKLVDRTGFHTVAGEVCLYRNGAESRRVELLGVNRSVRAGSLVRRMAELCDLVLIDGALDRRSSAMPTLAEGVILATGAVSGATVDSVVEKTFSVIRHLAVPVADGKTIERIEKHLSGNSNGILNPDGGWHHLPSHPGFGNHGRVPDPGEILVCSGALTDRYAQYLFDGSQTGEFRILVKDGTRLFLSDLTWNRMERKGISLEAIDSLKLLAVTSNPSSPYSPSLDGALLLEALKSRLSGIPVLDIKRGQSSS